MSASGRRLPPWALGLGGIVVLLGVLEVVPRIGLANPVFLPPSSTIISTLAGDVVTAEFWTALGQTLTTWAIGLVLAVAAGTVAGLVIGAVPPLRALTASTIEFLRPVPSVALIPVAVLLFGPTNIRSTLLLVVYASFWQVLVQILAGTQDVDPVAADTARSYRFSPLTRIRVVTWPTTLPFAMTGVRLSASVALILTMTGELLLDSSRGIGGKVAIAQQSGATPTMYAYIVVAGLLGIAVNLLARALERRLLFWHPSIRSEVAA